MKKISTFATILSLLGLLCLPSASAQMLMGGKGRNAQSQTMYNANTVTTILGKIIGIDKQSPNRGMSSGVHIQLETTDGTIAVHLGPAWYLDNQDIHLELGDQIEVTGSTVLILEKSVLIAAKVRKGDQILMLRDLNGIPMWSGWRRQ